MERSILFDKILNVVAISVSIIVFLLIMVFSPDMESGYKKYTIIAGAFVIFGALVSRLNAIKTSYIKKDWDEKVTELIDCNKKQTESNILLRETIDNHNKTLLWFEQRYSDDYDKIRKDLNKNTADDILTKKQVNENTSKIDNHEFRIKVLEKK